MVDLTGGLPTKSRQRRAMLTNGFVDQSDEHLMRAPATACFNAFQRRVVQTLRADQMVTKDTVVGLDWDASGCEWTVQLGSGRRMRAKQVVAAGGGALAPVVPEPLMPLHVARSAAVLHTMQVAALESTLQRPPAGTVVVVGGGLTAAHIVSVLAAGKCGRVLWMTRKPLRVQPFDVDFAWFSRFSAANKLFEFHSLSMPERAAELRRIKCGSLPPTVHAQVQALVATGRLELLEECSVTAATEQADGSVELTTSRGDVPSVRAALVIMCTGTRAAAELAPYLAAVRQTHPVPEIAGLPCLEPSLRWGKLPLFVMGPLAALCLGPYARNLRGARLAADRIADSLFEARGQAPARSALGRMQPTFTNPYAILMAEGDEDTDDEEGPDAAEMATTGSTAETVTALV